MLTISSSIQAGRRPAPPAAVISADPAAAVDVGAAHLTGAAAAREGELLVLRAERRLVEQLVAGTARAVGARLVQRVEGGIGADPHGGGGAAGRGRTGGRRQ